MKGTKLFLMINGFIWSSYAIMVAISPEMFGSFTGVDVTNNVIRIEVIAMYGGLQLAMGLFSIAGALRPSLLVPNLVFWSFAFTGLAGFRLLGVVMAGELFTMELGSPGPAAYNEGALWFFELPFAMISWYLLSKHKDAGVPGMA